GNRSNHGWIFLFLNGGPLGAERGAIAVRTAPCSGDGLRRNTRDREERFQTFRKPMNAVYFLPGRRLSAKHF
ncbi:hypothetical protein, partial [Raoultella terrigena]|uniref:hypothetical protein n=1 Tax=Raoultella terrigena TaxID=577 RepID=UPI001C701FD5